MAVLSLHEHRSWDAVLLPRAADIALTFEAQGLSNVLWALGRAGKRPQDGSVLPRLVAQALDMTVGGSRLSDERLLLPRPRSPTPARPQQSSEEAASPAPNQRHKAQGLPTPQFLCNITWALARLGYQHDAFMKAVEHAFPLAPAANVQNITNILWAFAVLERQSEPLFSKLGPRIIKLAAAGEIEPRALSNIAWSYAKMGMVSCLPR